MVKPIFLCNPTTLWTADSVRTKGAIFFMKRIIHHLFNESSIKTTTFSHAFFYLSPKIEEAYCQIKTGLLAVLPDHPTEGEIGFQILVQPNKPPWELEPVTVYIENVASEKLKALKNLNLDELHLRSRFSGVENFHIVCEYYNENGKSYLTAIQLKEGENWLDELWSK